MITRNTLISILVLMAGLSTGYFAFRMAGSLPAFKMQEGDIPQWPGRATAPDTSTYGFYGSSLELSHMYEGSKSDFQEVLEAGIRFVKEASLQRADLMASRDTLDAPSQELDRQIVEAEYSMDLHRLLDYYTNYFMHYYRWIDTGELPSTVSYKLAMGQFRATVAYQEEKYAGNANPAGMDLEELVAGTRVSVQSDRAVRWARVLTVILLFMLIMGIPRFIRDRGYRKFAASLYFDALFRPNKISDLNAWHSIPRLAMALIILYLFGGVILSSFNSWLIPVVLGSLGLLPILFLTVLLDNRRKFAEILVSLMAPKILIMVLFMLIMAVRGPMFFWYQLWISELFRAIFLAIFVMLIFHKFHVHAVLARKWSHRNRRGSVAMLGLAMGMQGLVLGILLLGFGLEESLLALNRELFLLPGAGPDSQGIAGWLALSPEFPLRLLLTAGIILVINLLIFLFNRKGPSPSSTRSLG